MRLRFRECDTYFTDSIERVDEYLPDNVLYGGVPTEREASVLVQGLPVYRALFVRNANAHHPPPPPSDATTTSTAAESEDAAYGDKEQEESTEESGTATSSPHQLY